MNLDAQLATIRRGTTEVIGEEEILNRIKKGKTLRVKLGVDPTAKDVTLGWAVVLRKLRDFQKMGHIACLIIGDFTAQIGDPSGKSKTRKQLTREEVQANVDAVSSQIYKILDPDKTEIYYNKDWLGKMTFEDVIRLCSRYTVARIMERDDFTKRFNNNQPIAMHEILYPLCQGMDSVEIKCDIEIGGNDQKFNNLVGRTLMEQYGQDPQAVILCPLLVGTDGKEKMSQSLGNYISIMDTPFEMIRKTMLITHEQVENWFELCTDVHPKVYKALVAEASKGRLSFLDVKLRLAMHIVDLYHPSPVPSTDTFGDSWSIPVVGEDEDDVFYSERNTYYTEAGDTASFGADAIEAVKLWLKRHRDRDFTSDADSAPIPSELVIDGMVALPSLIVAVGLATSNSKAKDLIAGGAVALDGEKVAEMRWSASDLSGKVLKVGKHQFRRLV